ncbi:SpoIIIAH-like family protein [Dethiothermospora halolimnae]|uniref:SpoIIIAH-like family protein n=1 Tax=Dethiothermospora halolimnae TaxID=3114390 RepID=UPI003CCC2D90
MIIKKKALLITSLVLVLVMVGYIHHQLTKQSLLDTSNDYEKHEEGLLAEMNDGENDINSETTLKELEEGEELNIDVNIEKDKDIDDLSTKVNDSIETSITKQENIEKNNYFIEYRLSRDKLRAELSEKLTSIIENDKTSKEIRTKAQEEIIRIGNVSETELYIEGLIKAKGFEDALVFLKENSGKVIVSVDELTEQDVMKILEIVKGETSIEASNITIMKKL